MDELKNPFLVKLNSSLRSSFILTSLQRTSAQSRLSKMSHLISLVEKAIINVPRGENVVRPFGRTRGTSLSHSGRLYGVVRSAQL